MLKEKLVKTLLNASELEESHSSVITKFFIEDFDWSGYDQEKVARVKDILLLIKKQTSEHNKILNDLIAYLDKSDKNEF